MRSLNARVVLIILFFAFIGFSGWSLRYFARYQPFADLIKENTQATVNRIGLQINDSVVVGRSNGRRHWSVAARLITVSRDRTSVDVTDIHHGILYDAQEHPVVAVSAGHATYAGLNAFSASSLMGSLNLDHGIRAVLLTHGGTTIQTDSLIWAASWNAVRCPGRVTVTFPNGSGMVNGENIVYETNTGNLTLQRLHGTFRVPNSVQ